MQRTILFALALGARAQHPDDLCPSGFIVQGAKYEAMHILNWEYGDTRNINWGIGSIDGL